MDDTDKALARLKRNFKLSKGLAGAYGRMAGKSLTINVVAVHPTEASALTKEETAKYKAIFSDLCAQARRRQAHPRNRPFQFVLRMRVNNLVSEVMDGFKQTIEPR